MCSVRIVVLRLEPFPQIVIQFTFSYLLHFFLSFWPDLTCFFTKRNIVNFLFNYQIWTGAPVRSCLLLAELLDSSHDPWPAVSHDTVIKETAESSSINQPCIMIQPHRFQKYDHHHKQRSWTAMRQDKAVLDPCTNQQWFPFAPRRVQLRGWGCTDNMGRLYTCRIVHVRSVFIYHSLNSIQGKCSSLIPVTSMRVLAFPYMHRISNNWPNPILASSK